MHILYFHQHFSTPAGAAGNRSYWMAKKLIERGHSVTMVCGGYGRGNTGLTGAFSNGVRCGQVDGIEIIELEVSYDNSDGFLSRTWKFLRFAMRGVVLSMKLEYDLVFATSTPLTAGIPGIVARWLRRKPFVFEVRDLWPELPRAMGVIKNPLVLWAMGVLEWVSYHSAVRTIALAPGIKAGILQRGIRDDRVAEIPNGCDLEIFADKSQPWRPEGVRDTDFIAVYAGTHGMANGLDAVLDAAGVLKARSRNDIKVVLVGGGMTKPGLESRAKSEILDNVIFHPSVPKERLVGLFAEADIGMQVLANVPAFYYGTSPNKFFDYIAAGLPVLINYPGWIADLVKTHECGFVVGPDDASSFANALECAADNRESVQKMGLQSRLLATDQFGRDQLATRFVEFLEGAVVR